MGGVTECPCCGQVIRGAARFCGGGHCATEREVIARRFHAGVKDQKRRTANLRRWKRAAHERYGGR